ncbi:VCBS repeat-containing protein [Dyella solisilvae]|uniref:VCBS repeat-containing protein n=1 Tax=Dyella solisilvae TaxID=1920168 RepID=A0A370K6A1_9GAMM|nr:VCBS repeat-containing protein [Dyella solisilvae]RDI98175.1 VCBS repeat-containing protein [Dyella solisilvae]
MNPGKLFVAAAMAVAFSSPVIARDNEGGSTTVSPWPSFLQEANEVFRPDYSYVAPDDVDGDGLSDLLWYNAREHKVGYWLSTWTYTYPYTYASGARQTFNVPSDYYVGAAGDLNGDRKVDLVLTSAKRDLWLWASNGAGFDASRIGEYPEGWQLLGAGDIDGDNNADLLWWNERKCEFGYWRMQGAIVLEKKTIKATCGYHVAAIGHFMQTNHLDLLWTSDAHDVYLWAGSDTGFTSTFLGNYDPQGHIIGAAIAGDFGGINVYVQNDAAMQFTQYEWVRYFDAQGNVGQTTFNAIRSLPINPGDYLGATGNLDGANEAVLVWGNDSVNAASTPRLPGGLTWYTNTVGAFSPFSNPWQSASIASYPAGWSLLGSGH